MTNIEERIKEDPVRFKEIFGGKKEDVAFALKDLSQKLDIIIWSAISDYAKEENVDVNLEEITSYKNLNKLIAKQLDGYIAEFLLQKRKDVE